MPAPSNGLRRLPTPTRTRTLGWATVARGYGVIPAIVLIALATAAQSPGPGTLPLPAILSTVTVRTSITTYSSFVFALAITQLTVEPASSIAVLSPRGWALTRAARLTAMASVAIAIAALTAPPHLSLKVITAVLAFTAEGLLSSILGGVRLAWALPLAHLLAGITFGTRDDGSAQPWAWFIAPHPPHHTTFVTLATAAAACLYWSFQYPADEEREDTD